MLSMLSMLSCGAGSPGTWHGGRKEHEDGRKGLWAGQGRDLSDPDKGVSWSLPPTILLTHRKDTKRILKKKHPKIPTNWFLMGRWSRTLKLKHQ